MHITVLGVAGILLAIATVMTSTSASALALPDDLAELLGDPQDAGSFDYCTSNSLGDETLLANLDAIMANAAGEQAEKQIAAAIIISAGLKVAAANPDACAETLATGRTAFDRQLATFTQVLRGQNRYDKSRDEAIAAVQAEIAEMWMADQVARQAYVTLQTDDRTGAPFWAWRLATAHTVSIDADATALMRGVLDQYDWVDRHRFGAKISEHAWLLVQHADDHPDFQKLALERMEPYLDNGGVKPANYAYLWDRVAINTGQLQRYGTQPVWQCKEDGSLDLHPIEDPDEVDKRRATLGMKPMQVELDQMASNFCGPQ